MENLEHKNLSKDKVISSDINPEQTLMKKKEMSLNPKEETKDDVEIVLKEFVSDSDNFCQDQLKKQNLDKEFALHCLNNPEALISLVNHLDDFYGLDKEIALALIAKDQQYPDFYLAQSVFTHAGKFEGLELNKELFLFCLENNVSSTVLDLHLDKFSGLDKEVALLILDQPSSEHNLVINHLDKFSGLDKEVALKLIKESQIDALCNHLDKFSDLDKEVAQLLIKNDPYHFSYQIIPNIDKFKDLELNKDFALFCINNNDPFFVRDNLEAFHDLDKEVAIKLIENHLTDTVLKYDYKFQGLELDKETALFCIEHEGGDAVMRYLDKFKGLECDKELALYLISHNSDYNVNLYLDNFNGLDKEVAFQLIQSAVSSSDSYREFAIGDILNHAEKFQGLEINKDLASYLIKLGASSALLDNINLFQGLDEEIAWSLIEEGYLPFVLTNKDKFKGLDCNKEFALSLIEKGYLSEFLEPDIYPHFKGLDEETALTAIKEKEQLDNLREVNKLLDFIDKLHFETVFKTEDYKNLLKQNFRNIITYNIFNESNINFLNYLRDKKISLDLTEKEQEELKAKLLEDGDLLLAIIDGDNSWPDLTYIFNTLSLLKKENYLIGGSLYEKEIEPRVLLKLNITLKNLAISERGSIERDLPSLLESFKTFLAESDFAQESPLSYHLKKSIYENLPWADFNLIIKTRNDAILLNNLDERFSVLRDIIHNHPSQLDVILIRSFNDCFQSTPEQQEEKYYDLLKLWRTRYGFENRNFYSFAEIQEFSKNPRVVESFQIIQADLEKLWLGQEALEEKIRNQYQFVPAELKEGMETLLAEVRATNNDNLALKLGNFRLDLELALNKNNAQKAELYILDRLLEQLSYKTYSEYLSKISEINEETLSQALEVLKSLLASCKVDHFESPEFTRITSVINTINSSSLEDLSKLSYYLELLEKEIANILTTQRQEFIRLIEKSGVQLSSSQKEALFSDIFRQKSIQFTDSLAQKIQKFLESKYSAKRDEALQKHEELLRFHESS